MIRNFVLAAALAAGGLAAAPEAASAGDFVVGLDVRPAYSGRPYYGGDYVAPAYHRGYRHRYRDYGYAPRRHYQPRPYYGYRPYRPSCRTVSVRSWNGYRYVTRVRETCGRRSYRY